MCSDCVATLAGRVYSTGRAWTSPEGRSCWSGTTTPTPPSLASRCSASPRTKTVSRNLVSLLCLSPGGEKKKKHFKMLGAGEKLRRPQVLVAF